jgi:hypothetical protein
MLIASLRKKLNTSAKRGSIPVVSTKADVTSARAVFRVLISHFLHLLEWESHSFVEGELRP